MVNIHTEAHPSGNLVSWIICYVWMSAMTVCAESTPGRMWSLRDKQLCADGDVLCDSCHGTAMRLVVWWTFRKAFGEGQCGSCLNNEMFVSPRIIHIMCCFSSCHIKIPMWLFWQQQKKSSGRFVYWSGKARKAKQLDTLLLFPNANGKWFLVIRILTVFNFSICVIIHGDFKGMCFCKDIFGGRVIVVGAGQWGGIKGVCLIYKHHKHPTMLHMLICMNYIASLPFHYILLLLLMYPFLMNAASIALIQL